MTQVGTQMVVFIKTAGNLSRYLPLEDGAESKRLDLSGPGPFTLGDIVAHLNIPTGLVAFGYSNGKLRRMSYEPDPGETITLQQPAAGG